MRSSVATAKENFERHSGGEIFVLAIHERKGFLFKRSFLTSASTARYEAPSCDWATDVK
jgi:aminoglycoside phosphotransferase